MYMGDLFTARFGQKGPSLGNTYIENTEKSYWVGYDQFVYKLDLIFTVNQFILKSNWGVYICYFYCKFCGKWLREYFFL